MLSAPAACPLLSPDRAAALLERARELRSGREGPGRFWKTNLDALGLDALEAAPYTLPRLSGAPAGSIVCDVATALSDYPHLVQSALGRAVDLQKSKFAATAAARCNSGAFVFVPAGLSAGETIEILYRDQEAALFTYTLIVLERGAGASVTERWAGERAGAVVCGVTEILAGESSHIEHVAVQSLAPDARAIWSRAAKTSKDASLTWCAADLGGMLAVTGIDSIIEAPGGDVHVNALFFPTEQQHVDVISSVDHRAGGSRSETLVKSAAAGAGQGRFLGNIRIAQDAQGTHASLRDDALLLSKQSHIDSVPALEIAANDVKAYHGATVGAIDDEQIFYMTSRGLNRSEAERMIALGFFEPVIERFPGAALRDELRTVLQGRLR